MRAQPNARSFALNALFGWWWADPVAALGMTYFLVAEGREAWRGEGKPLTGRVIAAKARVGEIGVDASEPSKALRARTSRP